MAGLLAIVVLILEAYGVYFFRKLFFGKTAKKINKYERLRYTLIAIVVALMLGFFSVLFSISRYEDQQVYGLSFWLVYIIVKDLLLIVPALIFHLLSWLNPNFWLSFIRDCFYLSLSAGLLFTLTCSNLLIEYFGITLRT